MHDLVLKHGTIIDPAQGIERELDVSIAHGRVAALGPDLPVPPSAREIDVRGKIVVPGLVDLHTHIYWGGSGNGVDVDEFCLKCGVTTAVDAGSCGSDNFAGFHRWIAGEARTRVLAFVHLSSMGLVSIAKAGELVNPAYADPDGAADLIRRHPEVIVGIKLRASRSAVGGSCLPMLRVARDLADSTGTILMIHIGDTEEQLGDILELLSPGDIVTHWATGKSGGLLGRNGRILPEVREARERQILFDAAHGLGNFDFAVAERLLDQGFPPDTISTDLSRRSVQGPVYDLLTTMTKFIYLGMSLPEVVRLSTRRPAEVLRREEQFGSLVPGMQADIAVLRLEAAQCLLTDSYGATKTADRRLTPFLTIRGGELVWPREVDT